VRARGLQECHLDSCRPGAPTGRVLQRKRQKPKLQAEMLSVGRQRPDWCGNLCVPLRVSACSALNQIRVVAALPLICVHLCSSVVDISFRVRSLNFAIGAWCLVFGVLLLIRVHLCSSVVDMSFRV